MANCVALAVTWLGCGQLQADPNTTDAPRSAYEISTPLTAKGTWLLTVSAGIVWLGCGSLAARRKHATPEEACFRRLEIACERHDAFDVFQEHTLWLAALEDQSCIPIPADHELKSAFPEWIEMELAMETCDPHWRGIRFLKVLKKQRAAALQIRRRARSGAGLVPSFWVAINSKVTG